MSSPRIADFFATRNVLLKFHSPSSLSPTYSPRVYSFPIVQARVVLTTCQLSFSSATRFVHPPSSAKHHFYRVIPHKCAPNQWLQYLGSLSAVETQAKCRNAGTAASTYHNCTAWCFTSECNRLINETPKATVELIHRVACAWATQRQDCNWRQVNVYKLKVELLSHYVSVHEVKGPTPSAHQESERLYFWTVQISNTGVALHSRIMCTHW